MVTQIIGLFAQCGTTVMARVLFVESFGVPLPATFLVIMAGDCVRNGSFDFVLVILIGSAAAAAGDIT